MEAKILPVSSLNDIVFEGRNKAYGAYALRQNYNRELNKAAGISFSVVLLLFGSFYYGTQLYPDAGQKHQPAFSKTKITEIVIEPYIPKPQEPAPIEPAPKTTQTAAPVIPQVATQEFREIKIVNDNTLVTDVIPSQTDFAQAEPGLATVAGELPGSASVSVEDGTGTGAAGNAEENTPFIAVEQMPEFPEGLAAMYKFINKHLRYPAEAQARGLEGAVVLTFVVSSTGEISDIQVIQDIGGGAAEEAKRVIRKMPNWQPGRQNKKAVPVRFTLPIKFKIN